MVLFPLRLMPTPMGKKAQSAHEVVIRPLLRLNQWVVDQKKLSHKKGYMAAPWKLFLIVIKVTTLININLQRGIEMTQK